MRLAVLRRVGTVVLALGLLGAMGVPSVLAASITVNSLADVAANDGACTLREAITAANTDTTSGAATGECAAGSGNDVIHFSVSGTIMLASALPDITTNTTISGNVSFSAKLHSVFGRTYRVIEVQNSKPKVVGEIKASSPAQI